MFPSDFAGVAGALVLVLALILLLRFGTRYLSTRRPAAPGSALAVVGQLTLDNRRRLQLVRCGDGHLLVLSGGTVDALLPWPAVPAPEPRP